MFAAPITTFIILILILVAIGYYLIPVDNLLSGRRAWSRDPVRFLSVDGDLWKQPSQMTNDTSIGFLTIVNKGSGDVERLVTGLQLSIEQRADKSWIYLFFDGIDSIQKRSLGAFSSCTLLNLTALNPSRAKYALPIALEQTLLRHPIAIFIDQNYELRTPDKLKEVLGVLGQTGQVVVPGSAYDGSTKKLNAFEEKRLPMFAFTRDAFMREIKPKLDCERGIACPEKIEGVDRRSIIRKETIDLRFIRSTNTAKRIALFKSLFETPQTGKKKVGIGLIWTCTSLNLGRLINEKYEIRLYVTMVRGEISEDACLETLRTSTSSLNISVNWASIEGAVVEIDEEIFQREEAIRDGCERFIGFRHGWMPPQHNWLELLVEGNVSSSKIALVAFVTKDNFEEIVALVGSVHRALWRLPLEQWPLIVLLVNDMENDTMKLWRNVIVLDLNALLLGISSKEPHLRLDDKPSRDRCLKMIQRKFGSHVLFAFPGIVMKANGWEKLQRSLREGKVYAGFNDQILLESYSPQESTKMEDIGKYGFELANQSERQGQHRCDLAFDLEIVSSLGKGLVRWAQAGDEAIFQQSKKTKIAMLIPTRSPTNLNDYLFLNTMLPSLIKSIGSEEWDQFIWTIYLGYDKGDRFLDIDQAELMRRIEEILGPKKAFILIRYRRLPDFKSLSLFWSVLFASAVNDGQQYFYQLGDDILFSPSSSRKSWSTALTDKLKEWEGMGVVGPNDQMWNCRLLTQTMVALPHFQIFQRYFPMAIRDWYTDNWISQVYGSTRTWCSKENGVKNSSGGARYEQCVNPPWKEAVAIGKKLVEKWRNRVPEHDITL